MLSTGELAKRLHLSVRTLRYYDQIGLVQPSERGNGGKRLYAEDDIFTLQKILLLKSLSLSLDEIQQILHEKSMASILSAHRSALEKQMQNIKQSITYTNSLLHTLELERELKWEDILSLVVTEQQPRNWTAYFTEDETELLKKQLPKLENDDLTTKKWMNLIKRTEMCMRNGHSPQSEEAQLLIDDINILSAETFNGDEELMNKFWDVRKSETASINLNLYPISQELLHFLEQALAHHEMN